MTLAEKILAAHSGKKSVRPGEFINVKVDLVMTTDGTGLISVRQFQKMGGEKVFDPGKIVLVMDHNAPAPNVESAETGRVLREFAFQQGTLFYDVGRSGIVHVLLPEQGLILPGDVVVGGDSHTCTYGALGAFATGMGATDIAYAMAFGQTWMQVPESIRLDYQGHLLPWVGGKDLILYTISQIGVEGANYKAIEFTGQVVEALGMDDRFTMANMAVEAGAKAGLFPVDEETLAYLKERAKRPYTVYQPDPDATYARTLEIDVCSLEPQVAFPHSTANARPISQTGEVEIDQAVIGSCTNGRITDLRVASRMLAGRKIHPRVRCIVLPGSQEVYLEALREGLIEIFIQAGAAVSTPTCGPCVGGHMGVVGAGERCISTTNRNFIGRMGSPKAEIYLANPSVVAASAVKGRIVHPQEVVGR
jgi:3-isopropylmalate/(R)-2-methylmalate dehydratase large subunit